MKKIISIGFNQVGCWELDVESGFSYVLHNFAAHKNILYAFVCNDEVMYIGKTVRTLKERMSGYKNPGLTQTTNINNRKLIIESLQKNEAVEIYALPDHGLLNYGGFHLNLAAGLEDDLIRQLKPLWNGGKPDPIECQIHDETSEKYELIDLVESFNFNLERTYYNHGFFNISVANQHHLGGDGQKIELFLDSSDGPIIGLINRSTNQNRTPRIFGYGKLKSWFQRKGQINSEIWVGVISPTAIRLKIIN